MAFYLDKFIRGSEARNLAPIAAVMPVWSLAFCSVGRTGI